MKHIRSLALLGIATLLGSCGSLGSAHDGFQIYESQAGQPIELEAMIDELQDSDVVFLGEEHDNDVGHQLQLETVQALAKARPDLIISLEQFEADVQYVLDLYLAGGISEELFLENSRPWSNYKAHYRPIIEFAKQNKIPVVAANIPRPLANTVAHEGLQAIAESRIASPMTWTDEPEYMELFAEAMGRSHVDSDDQGLERWFAAQCVKDEKMAESISHALVRAWSTGKRPLVVHINGKFHSNQGLGTVSRLRRRHPRLDIRVIGMNSTNQWRREPSEKELREADYMWLVAPQ